jgi:tetratricopeptide (TPR) repeat protein
MGGGLRAAAFIVSETGLIRMAPDQNADVAGWRSEPILVEIDALCAQGRLPEAITRAEQARGAGVAHPMVLNLIAYGQRLSGRLDAAIATIREAIEIDPTTPSLKIALGNYLATAGRPRDALEAFEAALQRTPNNILALNGKALALLRTGRYEPAERLFQTVLAASPGNVDASVGLAALACQRNDHARARRLAEAALTVDPKSADAALVLMEVSNAEKRFNDCRDAGRVLLERTDLPPLDRGLATLLMAEALHGAGFFAEAFDAYTRGKAIYKDAYAADFAAPNIEVEANKVQRLAEYFRQTDPAPWRVPAPETLSSARIGGHAVLVGFPRSGTTLLEHIFATHDDIVALDEVSTLTYTARVSFSNNSALDSFAILNPVEAEMHRFEHWGRVRDQMLIPEGSILLEKLPIYTMYIPAIRKLFSNARIIIAIRDPRDVVLSCFRRNFNINTTTFEFTTLESTAHYYNSVMEILEAWRAIDDRNLFMVRNEDLIADFDLWSRRLCDFVGVEWTDSLRDFAVQARKRDIRTPSANQVRQGLNAGGVGQWRAYREQLAPVLPLLAPWVRRFGYPED